MVNISVGDKYDLSIFSVQRNLFKCTASGLSETRSENEMQFDITEGIKHADNLRLRAFSLLTVTENILNA